MTDSHVKKHSSKVKRGKGVILLEVLYVIAAAALVGMVAYMNVLPEKYFIPFLVLVGVITALLFVLCHIRRKGAIKAGIIMSLVFILLFGTGCGYIIHTLGFFKNITSGIETRDYCVFVPESSKAEALEDLQGKEVYVLANATDADKDAMAQLSELTSVSYVENESYADIADAIKDGECEAAMLGAEYLEMIDESEDYEGFADTVRTLDTITVRMAAGGDSSKVDVTKDCFIIYITGIDTEGTVAATARSDVNMLAVVNPTSHKVLLVSIPRDYYVTLHTAGQKDKLTHTGIHGVQETMATIEDLYGIDIDHYVKINFTGTRNLIDAIGGIDIESEYAFTTYKGGYTIQQGTNHLNGDQALSFARERKHVPGGDNQRIKDQQIVIEAVIGKVTQSETILKNYNQLLSAMKDNLATSMSEREMTSLVKMQLKDMPDWEISKISATGEGAHGSCYSAGGTYAYVMEPTSDSIAEVKTSIDQAINDGTVIGDEDLPWYLKAWYWVQNLFQKE